MRGRGFKQRPEFFQITEGAHTLKRGLVFAGLGLTAPRKTARYHDSSARGNHGTLTGMTPATAWTWNSTIGQWLVDHGGDVSGDYVQLGHAITFAATDSWTFSCWTDIDSLFGYEGLVGNEYATGKYTRFYRGHYTGAERVYNDANSYVSPAAGYVQTGLHHYAVTSVASAITTYRDGTLQQSLGAPPSAGTWTFLRLGCLGRTTAGSLDGRMGGTLIHSRALSLAEIAILANPSDPMLGGMIVPPPRKLFAVASVAAAKYYARRRTQKAPQEPRFWLSW